MTAALRNPAIQAAVAAIVATETAGQPMTADQYWTLYGACQDAAAPADRHDSLKMYDAADAAIAASRGAIASPDGTHGPFPGCRCVYCGANDLDVELYTVDPTVCPPVWACGARHPDLRLPHCQLSPEHDSGHSYDDYVWPELPDELAAKFADDFDVVMYGPPQLRTITWPRTAA